MSAPVTVSHADSAYVRGDFRSTRALARALKNAPDATTRDRAGDLLRATGVDSLITLILFGCLGLFAFVIWFFLK